ncbi:flagellar hook-length control protein FliK [bacterium]|nr:flagellar hook-length control protein FliK [bacterium]
MFDKMLGVSPPRKGDANDSKLADSKNFRGTSKSEYKKDFESALNAKSDKKKDPVEKKEVAKRENEPKADLKGKKAVAKSLGGIKKKVTENEDKIVSNVMASQESKVETPVQKIKDPAEIEIDIPEKTKTADTSAQAAGGLLGLLAQQAPAAQSLQGPLSHLDFQKPVVNQQLATDPVNQQLQQQAAGEAKPQNAMANFEAELGAAVNFVPDAKADQNKDLLAKLKSFEGEKNPSAVKSQSFEQSVLSRLQNEQSLAQLPVAGQAMSDQSQKGFDHKDSDQLKDLKSELLNTNQMHQAAGQSHNDFKANLNAATAPETSLSKLEENREANIDSIMSQAQYLVKKGGGEISVKMSPEGMGEVHLKVLLQDGKLNIEMQTQDKNVKKLIEESLSDLKSGLAAHRLSLEHVKVDTVNATNADNNMQFQSNLNHGGSEGRAQELWNGFQQNMNNQSGKKSSYSDSASSPKVSSNESNRTAQVSPAIRTYGGTKGATVNRVA